MSNTFFLARVEIPVPCTRRGRPSYRWVAGWSDVGADGSYSNPLALREVQAIARRDGYAIRRFKSVEAAQRAAQRAAAAAKARPVARCATLPAVLKIVSDPR